MDLEPGEDPFVALVPPGKSVGGPMADAEHDHEHHEVER
jgi:hypothetical protein